MILLRGSSSFFFFNDTATTEIYTLSLHDALPILPLAVGELPGRLPRRELEPDGRRGLHDLQRVEQRSEEHTSELQSHLNLVCRLLLEKKKKDISYVTTYRHTNEREIMTCCVPQPN